MGNIVYTIVMSKCVLKAIPFAMVLQHVRGCVLTIHVLAFDSYFNFISEISRIMPKQLSIIFSAFEKNYRLNILLYVDQYQ